MKLPVCQGPSFVPVGAIIGIYFGANGMDTVLGASIVGAAAVILLGFTGIYKYIVRHFIPTDRQWNDHYDRWFDAAANGIY